MPYLNHPYENSFKELCASMPLFYLDVYEMREILKVQGRLADELRASTERVISNEFILLADEQTVALWEGMLHITYDKPMTLDERKAVIMGHICGYAHIGEPEIREIASLYTTSKVSVAFSKGVIYIDVEGVDLGFALSNFLDTLLKRIPAHLALKYFSTFTGYQIQPDIMRIGGTGSIFMEFPVPQEQDDYDFQNTTRVGGMASIEHNMAVPQAKDEYDLRSAARIGGTGAIGTNIAIPQAEDSFDFRRAARIGGTGAVETNMAIPAKPDDFRFEDKARIGGEGSIGTNMAIPQQEDAFEFRDAARIGGAGAVGSIMPVPQQEDHFEFQDSLRAGGAGAIGPSMPVPEQGDTFQFKDIIRAGGTGTTETSIPVPEQADDTRIKSKINAGGQNIGVTASLSVPEIEKEE